VAVQVNGGTRYAGLVEWLDGSTLYDLTNNKHKNKQNRALLKDTLEQLGEIMAKLHNHSETWQPSPAFTRHRLDSDGFFGHNPHWGRYWDAPLLDSDQRLILEETRPQIIQKLAMLGETPDVFGMAHTDLHHGNVFITPQGLYLIDFDDAGFSWYLYDIAVALQEYQARDDFSALEEAILRGYRRYRPLSVEHTELITLFLHIRSRATIGWASARPELGNAERIKQLIVATCAEAQEYFK
jgi:Ser/Thr protein kinase RdoA (MazF antagonist)